MWGVLTKCALVGLCKRPDPIFTTAEALQKSIVSDMVRLEEVCAGLLGEGPTVLVLRHACPRKGAPAEGRGVRLGISILYHHC